MAIIRKQQQAAFIAKFAAGEIKAALVHGGDPGGVAELAGRLLRAATGGADDPMAITTLDEEMLGDDPGRLADEVQSLSMFGPRRAIRVRHAGNAFLKALETALAAAPDFTAAVVAESGPLKPAAKLRKLFETRADLAALPVYEDDARDLAALAREVLQAHELRIAPEALRTLTALLGANRIASRNEVEKLALYCRGKGMVAEEDVIAACGDVAAHAIDRLIDAAMEGDAAAAAREFTAITAAGDDPSKVLGALGQHLMRLREMALAARAGESPQRVIEAARPPIFFKRKDSFAKQLARWRPEALQNAAAGVLEATANCRARPELAAAIAERCLFSLAGHARRAGR